MVRLPDIDRWHVVIRIMVAIESPAFLPGKATIGRAGDHDVELGIAIVLPHRVQVAVRLVDRDAREVVGADERAWDALFWAASEVALRLADDNVVTDFGR